MLSTPSTQLEIAFVHYAELMIEAGKRGNTQYTQLSEYVPKDLAEKFRKICRERKLQHSDIFEKLLSEWVKNNI